MDEWSEAWSNRLRWQLPAWRVWRTDSWPGWYGSVWHAVPRSGGARIDADNPIGLRRLAWNADRAA